jgi:protocatechuate 3,4-dioxygenase beta subunit
LRLALQIVDESCNPITGAKVEIWHTQKTGIYSGPTPNPGMCSNNDATAIAAMYFRGSQTADSNGRVNFDSCFPGWYSSRAIHIHFRVTIGGSEYVVSQLFFSEDLISEIFSTHPDYSPFGQPDTHLSNDNVIGGVSDKTPYILETARMSDGAMLASKRIAVRSSLATSVCMAGR